MASSDGHLDSDGQAYNRLSQKYKIMEVNFITGGASEIPLRQATTRQTPVPTAASDTNSADFDTSNSIAQSFSQTSATRADKIARANELLSDPSYPSGQVLNELAGFLAKRL